VVGEHQKSVNLYRIMWQIQTKLMPKFSCVKMKSRHSGRVQAREQVYPRTSTRQQRKNTSPEPSPSMDEAGVQLRHEINHATAKAPFEEMAHPLELVLPQGPLDALRRYLYHLLGSESIY
jgi:hypothetical protein